MEINEILLTMQIDDNHFKRLEKDVKEIKDFLLGDEFYENGALIQKIYDEIDEYIINGSTGNVGNYFSISWRE
jgi:hypothetical protein